LKIDIMQSRFQNQIPTRVDSPSLVWLHRRVKWLAVISLVVLFAAANSCTTLVNRHDLYSPEPAPDSREAIDVDHDDDNHESQRRGFAAAPQFR